MGRCATCANAERYSEPVERRANFGSAELAPLRATEPQGESVVIDHLIVVDRSAARYAREQLGGVEAMARLAVETMNNAMRNSDVAATFRLAGIMELEEEFASIDHGHDYILNGEAVRARRRALRADVVTLCVQNIGDGTTGVATQEAKRAMAYSTVMASSISGYVVAHEVAHIFGCQHSRGEERADKGQHAYAVGTVRSPYYTIMGYPSDSQNAHELAPIYSGVKSVWRGVQLGSPTEDNVRMLRERMHEVSTFGDYLDAKYYVDKAEHYVDNSPGVVHIDVKTSEFFQPQSDASWLHTSLSNGQSFSLDDVVLTIRVDANTSGKPRSARVTLSGTDSYEPVVITIHQGAEQPNGTAIVEVAELEPRLVSSGGALVLRGASVEALELYTLTGERVLRLGQTAEGTSLPEGLPSGGYVCRVVRSGQVRTQKIVL